MEKYTYNWYKRINSNESTLPVMELKFQPGHFLEEEQPNCACIFDLKMQGLQQGLVGYIEIGIQMH